MARQTREREYDASDLKSLMDNTGDWATGWDDVLRYLERGAESVPDLQPKEVSQMTSDVRHLRDDGIPYTTDYREVWKELTGSDTKALSAPQEEQSGEPKASSRVLDVLQRVQSKEYREMAERLDATGDAGWEHSR